ncbi:hypothetical protein BH09BAC6_BH09BAC6_35980 [soil metagenome]
MKNEWQPGKFKGRINFDGEGKENDAYYGIRKKFK